MKKVIIITMTLICFCFAGLSKNIKFSTSELTISEIIKAKDSNEYQKAQKILLLK